jgi:glycosyltransferase involved in cell wall biosynthesis
MFSEAAGIIVLGEKWRRFVETRAPDTAGRIVIVPNAAPPPTLPHIGGGEAVHILFLGRLNAMKGVPQLCDALRRLAGLDGWRATLAGDGEVAVTRRRLAALGIAGKVELPGWVDGARVAELIAEADILVLPSFIENLPVSVVEGMASGLAIVATPVGAVEDIVHDGETGLLVPPGDVDALAAALTRLVTDPALRTRLGAAAMALHRERLELQPFADAICAVWADAAATTRTAGGPARELRP